MEVKQLYDSNGEPFYPKVAGDNQPYSYGIINAVRLWIRYDNGNNVDVIKGNY